MLDNVFSFFEKLLLNFTWTRFTFVVSAVLLLLASLAVFEFYTGHFRLARIEREIRILEQVVDLSKKIENTSSTDPSRATYERVAKYIGQQVATPPLQIGNIPELPSRIIFGSVPWLVLALFVLVTTKTGRLSAIGGMSIFAIPFIVVGANLPDSWDPRITRYLYPWASMVTLVIGIMSVQRRRTA